MSPRELFSYLKSIAISENLTIDESVMDKEIMVHDLTKNQSFPLHKAILVQDTDNIILYVN